VLVVVDHTLVVVEEQEVLLRIILIVLEVVIYHVGLDLLVDYLGLEVILLQLVLVVLEIILMDKVDPKEELKVDTHLLLD
jgi:hypothetical protein